MGYVSKYIKKFTAPWLKIIYIRYQINWQFLKYKKIHFAQLQISQEKYNQYDRKILPPKSVGGFTFVQWILKVCQPTRDYFIFRD